MRPYDIGSVVQYEGKSWRVTDVWFDLRNLEALDSDEFVRVPVYKLDAENTVKVINEPLPFDELPTTTFLGYKPL